VKGNGVFAGETTADMLFNLGALWVFIGQSERRGKGGTGDEEPAMGPLSSRRCCADGALAAASTFKASGKGVWFCSSSISSELDWP